MRVRVRLRFTVRFWVTLTVRFGVCVRIMATIQVGLGLGSG